MAAHDPAERSELARLAAPSRWSKVRDRTAAFARWCREHARRIFVMALWLVTFALPPVAVLLLPAQAQTIITYLLASVPLSLVITWRVTDSRKHD